jgi:DNA-binding winged helix-turn-helix (wHTH) protein
MSAPPTRVFEFGSFHLDLSERLLLKDGRPVPLTSKAFEVLTLLIEHQGHLIEKDTLMSEVWADSFVEEANISRTIWMLRRALGKDKNGQDYIQTIPKHGYRFVADVAEISGNSK